MKTKTPSNFSCTEKLRGIDGGWSWDRTVVSTTLTFVNQELVAIGNLPDRYKDKNPFRPDVWIQQDVTVKHR
jgi:hypothetical protein